MYDRFSSYGGYASYNREADDWESECNDSDEGRDQDAHLKAYLADAPFGPMGSPVEWRAHGLEELRAWDGSDNPGHRDSWGSGPGALR